jgi:hypothetical protein
MLEWKTPQLETGTACRSLEECQYMILNLLYGSVVMRDFYGRFLSLREIPVPLIAALNGPAIGAGLCISLFADMRIAAKDAKLGFTFVNLGLHPVRLLLDMSDIFVNIHSSKFLCRAWLVPISFHQLLALRLQTTSCFLEGYRL